MKRRSLFSPRLLSSTSEAGLSCRACYRQFIYDCPQMMTRTTRSISFASKVGASSILGARGNVKKRIAQRPIIPSYQGGKNTKLRKPSSSSSTKGLQPRTASSTTAYGSIPSPSPSIVTSAGSRHLNIRLVQEVAPSPSSSSTSPKWRGWLVTGAIVLPVCCALYMSMASSPIPAQPHTLLMTMYKQEDSDKGAVSNLFRSSSRLFLFPFAFTSSGPGADEVTHYFLLLPRGHPHTQHQDMRSPPPSQLRQRLQGSPHPPPSPSSPQKTVVVLKVVSKSPYEHYILPSLSPSYLETTPSSEGLPQGVVEVSLSVHHEGALPDFAWDVIEQHLLGSTTPRVSFQQRVVLPAVFLQPLVGEPIGRPSILRRGNQKHSGKINSRGSKQ